MRFNKIASIISKSQILMRSLPSSSLSSEALTGVISSGDNSKSIQFTLFSALAVAISYADRSNLSTAIIPMAGNLKDGQMFSII